MELMTWSDGKLEERLERIDERFEQVDRRFEQVDKRFDRIEADIAELRGKLDWITIGLLLGFPAVIATIPSRGG
jgi:tetrahydromethanopterin S-methyltransferase subunit G